MKRLLCLIGMHDWEPSRMDWYGRPRCRRCGRWYAPRNVVQKNIIAGGDVCAGNIYHDSKPKDKP